MLNFESDYLEGAHEKILQRMLETNEEKLSGYGRDKYSASAVEKFAKPVFVLKQMFSSSLAVR